MWTNWETEKRNDRRWTIATNYLYNYAPKIEVKYIIAYINHKWEEKFNDDYVIENITVFKIILRTKFRVKL